MLGVHDGYRMNVIPRRTLTPMSMARRIELTGAIACLVLAVLGALYALFGPTISVSTSESVSVANSTGADEPIPEPIVTNTDHRSLYEDGIETAAVVYIGLMVGLSGAVLLLAMVHGRSTATRSAAPVWSVAAAMMLFALIAGFSIGLLFFPAALAAIVAAAAGTARGRELRRSAA